MSKLTLFFLGPPRLLREDGAVEPDTRKAVALLAFLAITREVYSRDSLAALLYPEYDDTHARGALRRTLSSLHKALGGEHLKISREQVELPESPYIWVDVQRFEVLIAQVERHSHNDPEHCPECITKLEAAVELYRGDFLAGFSLRDSPAFDDWKFFQGESLQRRFSSALERLARSYRRRGQMEPAIKTARRWLALDPLVEDAHRELMRIYAQAGQRNAALRQYNECARILEKELGVQPLEETRNLQQAILDYRYQAAAPVDTTQETETDLHKEPGESQIPHAFPLIGREKSWEMLLDKYRGRAPEGFFVALEGEPGIGKTRLAEELLAFALRQGAVTLTTRCFEGESSLAYASIIELLRSAIDGAAESKLESVSKLWLSESARLLTDLRQRYPDLPEPQPLSSPGAQSVFFEGIRQTLFCLGAEDPPGIIFIDDAHWADAASLDLIAYLIRRLTGHSMLILIAWREGALPPQTRLRGLLSEGQRSGHATGIRLERLSVEDVSQLARRVISYRIDLSNSFSQKLYKESEGLPLVVVEYLEAFLTSPSQDGNTTAFKMTETEWRVPENTKELFLRRLSALDELSRQLLTAAAVIGRSFDFETLAAVAGRSEAETMLGLELLISHGIVQECGHCDNPQQIRYDFTHEILRSLVYTECSQVRRKLLHARTGHVLEEIFQHSAVSGILAGQIAQHLRLAGETPSAAQYYRVAADQARRLYANKLALEMYEAALSLKPEKPLELYENIGDLHTLIGEYGAAIDAYRQAKSLSTTAELAQIEHKIGNVHQRRGEWNSAIEQYRHALADASPDQGDLAARCLADWSLTVMQTGPLDVAEELAERALLRAAASEAVPALAQAHNLLGILQRRRKQYQAAQANLEKSLELGIKMADDHIQTAALNNLALLSEETGDLPTALDYTQKALGKCEKLGDRHRAAALHNHMADLYQHTGQPALAMEHLKQAVTIFAEIGGSVEDIQPEIWKLTEW